MGLNNSEEIFSFCGFVYLALRRLDVDSLMCLFVYLYESEYLCFRGDLQGRRGIADEMQIPEYFKLLKFLQKFQCGGIDCRVV